MTTTVEEKRARGRPRHDGQWTKAKLTNEQRTFCRQRGGGVVSEGIRRIVQEAIILALDICHHPDCLEAGISFEIGDPWDPTTPTTEYVYCAAHAHEHGFCAGCGQFWGGVESFEFGNPTGLCANCRSSERWDGVEEDAEDFLGGYS